MAKGIRELLMKKKQDGKRIFLGYVDCKARVFLSVHLDLGEDHG